MTKKFRAYENFHLVLWMMKDTCWIMDWQSAGVVMIVPTVLAALHITWLSRKNQADFLHNLAIIQWLCADSIWMIGEFFYDDSLGPISKLFFVIGLSILAVYYFYLLPKGYYQQRKNRR